MKRNFKWMLAAILTISGVINMYAEDNFALERISNPSLGVGEIDGFMPGGDLDNDYTTSMATCGDYIYIATSRNLGSGWVNVFTPKCDFWGIFSDAIWASTHAMINSTVPTSSCITAKMAHSSMQLLRGTILPLSEVRTLSATVVLSPLTTLYISVPSALTPT